MTTVQQLTDEVVAWADSQFPGRTPQSALLKMFEEIGELIKDLHSPDEYADVLIMLLDLANMHGINVTQAVRTKLEVNRQRTWAATPSGTFQHETTTNPHECGRMLSSGIACTRPKFSTCAACI